jgi:hypothetical protein
MAHGKGSQVPSIRLRLAVATAAISIIGLAASPSATASMAGRPDVPATTVPQASFQAIACPTSKVCLAVGSDDNENGKSAVINTATGAVHAGSGKLADEFLESAACPGKSECLALATNAVATVKASNGAMKVTAKPKPPADGIVGLSAIACANSKNCYAVGFEESGRSSVGVVVRLSGAGKQLGLVKSHGTGVGEIACPSSKLCLVSSASSAGEVIQQLSNGRLGASHPVPAKTFIERIACYQSKVCFAVGGKIASGFTPTDELFPLNPKTGAIGKVVTIKGFSATGMTCASATECMLVGYTGEGATAVPSVVTVNHGKPGKPTKVGPASGSLSAIACVSSKLCYAVGQSGTNGLVVKT